MTLLILTLETVVEQIAGRFKAPPEEDTYRLVCMLLQDAMQVRIGAMRLNVLRLKPVRSNMPVVL